MSVPFSYLPDFHVRGTGASPFALLFLGSCYHKTMAKPATHAQTALTNTFGALGYASILTQWLWALVTVGYPLITSDKWRLLIPKPTEPSPQQPIELGVLSPVVTGIAIVFTLAVLALTIYVLTKLPTTIGKTGHRVTQSTATVIAPAVNHKKLSKKQRATLTFTLTWWVKLVLIIVPFAALRLASPQTGLEPLVVLTIGGFCAAMSMLWIGIQYLCYKILRLLPEQVW